METEDYGKERGVDELESRSLARAQQRLRGHVDLLGRFDRREPLGDPAFQSRAEVNEKPAIFPAQNFHRRAAWQRHDERPRRARGVPDVERCDIDVARLAERL